MCHSHSYGFIQWNEIKDPLGPLLLQIRTLRPREGKEFVQHHVVSPSSVFSSLHQAASNRYYLNKASGV